MIRDERSTKAELKAEPWQKLLYHLTAKACQFYCDLIATVWTA